MNATISSAELLHHAARLEGRDFDQFVSSIMALRARRLGKGRSVRETELLKKINRGLSEEKLERFQHLNERRRAASLTEAEHQELLSIIAEIEQSDADRVLHLGELAQIRNTSVPELMKQLGLVPAQLYA